MNCSICFNSAGVIKDTLLWFCYERFDFKGIINVSSIMITPNLDIHKFGVAGMCAIVYIVLLHRFLYIIVKFLFILAQFQIFIHWIVVSKSTWPCNSDSELLVCMTLLTHSRMSTALTSCLLLLYSK